MLKSRRLFLTGEVNDDMAKAGEFSGSTVAVEQIGVIEESWRKLVRFPDPSTTRINDECPAWLEVFWCQSGDHFLYCLDGCCLPFPWLFLLGSFKPNFLGGEIPLESLDQCQKLHWRPYHHFTGVCWTLSPNDQIFVQQLLFLEVRLWFQNALPSGCCPKKIRTLMQETITRGDPPQFATTRQSFDGRSPSRIVGHNRG